MDLSTGGGGTVTASDFPEFRQRGIFGLLRDEGKSGEDVGEFLFGQAIYNPPDH